MTTADEPTGTLALALAQAARLLEASPALAAEQALEILKVHPGHPAATLLWGHALRATGATAAALRVLEPLARAHAGWGALQFELAMAFAQADRPEPAIVALRRAVALDPDLPNAWRALGDQLTITGDERGADAAYARHIQASTRDPRLLAAAGALSENRLPEAEAMLRAHLKKYPTDVAAIRMFAEVAARLRRYADAENLLARCLELAPSFSAARHNYAIVLQRQNKAAEALREVEALLAGEPRNPGYTNLKAAILARIGDFSQSIRLYAAVLERNPDQPKIWMSYGHALKTAGREAESIDAYRRSIELAPSLGEAYWSLANLKTRRFPPCEVEAMTKQLGRPDLEDEDRLHLHFAMGKALEDAGDYRGSFVHYAEGNRLRRLQVTYNAEEMTTHVRRSKKLFGAAFFRDRGGFGLQAPDPIFVIGMPRAGSTLIEQILASHSCVEGTMELPDISAIARTLTDEARRSNVEGYGEVLARSSAAACREMGARYLSQTRIQRKSAAPFFIDKMPNNFAHVDIIQLALPRAKIIDARRHPLGCCFSVFKQQFARGQNFSYSLEDVGRYYRDYAELMAHYDVVLPGRIHRVYYESMIEDTEREVRRLLEYCGLAFEEGCLRFHQNERAVRTASSQQVRRPIFREGLEHWRHFEPWLGPLKSALGSVLDDYPHASKIALC